MKIVVCVFFWYTCPSNIKYHPNVAKISQYAPPRCYGYLWVSSTWMPVPLDPVDPLDPEAAKAAKIKVANVHAGDRRKQGFAKGT